METINLKTPVTNYKAYIVDLDGTLYYQPSLRLYMAFHIVKHLICHPFSLKDIYVVYRYRKLREKGTLSGGLSNSSEEAIIHGWMIETPLIYIKKTRDKTLIDFLNNRALEGAGIIVYSDYPTREKLSVLSLNFKSSYHSGQTLINCLKPDTKGLLNILETEGLDPRDCLFIGDRMEKDGLCARGAGMDYLILPRKRSPREKVFKALGLFL